MQRDARFKALQLHGRPPERLRHAPAKRIFVLVIVLQHDDSLGIEDREPVFHLGRRPRLYEGVVAYPAGRPHRHNRRLLLDVPP